MEAQTIVGSPVGEYYLGGVPETACGLKLSEDSSFQFYFSQGALDRFGEGKWEMRDKRIFLNSRKRPPHDFSLVESRKDAHDGISLQISEQNEIVKRYVYARITGGGKVQEAMANEDGLIKFEKQPIATIELIFQFCPEKTSIFKINQAQHNYFEFKFEPWMMEIFFDNFSFGIDAENLIGGNPVLQGSAFTYRKAGEK